MTQLCEGDNSFPMPDADIDEGTPEQRGGLLEDEQVEFASRSSRTDQSSPELRRQETQASTKTNEDRMMVEVAAWNIGGGRLGREVLKFPPRSRQLAKSVLPAHTRSDSEKHPCCPHNVERVDLGPFQN